MHTEDLRDLVEKLLDEVDGPEEPGIPDEATDGAFTEMVDGEVIEDPPHLKGVPIRWLIPIGIAALAIALVLVLIIPPLFSASATIIITPDVQPITVSGDITVPAKTLIHKTMTLSEQVPTTGTAHQAATQAHGWVTFYNSLQAPQTVPAGTMLIGADGTHVTINDDVYIPAGTLATNGSASILAHASIVGTAGNIPAGDVNGPCCRDYVFAYNNAFTGGQDTREYRTATNTDISVGIKELSSLITTEVTTDAQHQLSFNETMSTPQCQHTFTAPKPGAEATQVMVTVTSTCTVYGYDRTTIATQEQDLFNQAIQDQLGPGYVVKGKTAETATHATLHTNTLVLAVTLTGTTVYHFRIDEIQHMQQVVAGKSREQATALLLHVRGVHTVGVQTGNGRGSVPDNPSSVLIDVYEKG